MSMDDIVSRLLTESKAFATANKKAKKKARSVLDVGKVVFAERTSPGLATIKNPWHDAALIQMMNSSTCKNCGNTGTSWEPYIFLEQTRTVRGSLERNITRIETCEYQDIYKSYPRKVEVREIESCSCPHCFKDYLVDTTQPAQMNLQLTQEKQNG